MILQILFYPYLIYVDTRLAIHHVTVWARQTGVTPGPRVVTTCDRKACVLNKKVHTLII